MLTKWTKYPELSLKKVKNYVILNNATLLDVVKNSFALKRLHYKKKNWTTLQTANKKC